ncbi:hypothetical protein GCM10020255_007510 [Rhodococcus baikonurensis]
MTPIRYAHRIETGLKVSVGGDFAYGGQLTKNPIHPDWATIYGPSTPYTLRQLATIHTPRQAPRRPDRAAGLGRNVTMFDTARKWAYPQWWHHRNGTADQWLRLVLQHCHAVNTEFADPCLSSKSGRPLTPSVNGSGATSTKAPTAHAKLTSGAKAAKPAPRS